MQLGTNHLGHFALTGLLLDQLARAESARIVTVSSLGHWAGRVNFDDLQGTRSYDRLTAYFQSKLANVLFMRELQRRLEAARLPIISVGCHPGLAATNLGEKIEKTSFEQWLMKVINGFFAQSSSMGALPTLYAATSGEVRGGQHYGPWLFGTWGVPTRAWVSPLARSKALAQKLWDQSVALTGVTFEALPKAA